MKWMLFACLTFFVQQIVAQSYEQDFKKALEVNDTTTQRELLEKWQVAHGDDPELVLAWFTYYARLSKHKALTDSLKPYQNNSGFHHTNYTGKNCQPFFVERYEVVWFDSLTLEKGFQKIQSGMKRYPNRLDFRFLYADVLGEIKEYPTQALVVLELMDHSKKINHKWLKEHNTKFPKAKSYLLERILGYEVQLFELEEEAVLDEMLQIAQKMVEFEPDFLPGWLSLSLAEIGKKNYDEAIKSLEKALKINAKEIVALNNMAYCYSMKGDNENAIHYYEEVIRYGDKNDQFLAREEIMYLKK